MAAIPAMLHSIDSAGRLVFVSDVWLAKLGYARDEVLGRFFIEFLTAESQQYALAVTMPAFFASGRCENISYQMVKKTGDVMDVLLSATLSEDASGRGQISASVLTDVSELLEAKRLLGEGEARYRNLVEDQSDLVSLATPEGVLRYANPAYAAIYGRRPENLIGKSLFSFVPKEERGPLAEHLKCVCETREKTESQNQVLLPNGEKRWIAWINRALFDADGNVLAIHSVGRDIQTRVEAERRLQESEARYRFLAEHSSDMIILIGEHGRRLYVSPACRKMLGYEPEEAAALRLEDAIHPEDAARVLPILAAKPADTMFSYRMRRKDGSYAWVETAGKTVEVANGERHRLVIVRDIEQRIEAERRLKASETRYRLLADNSTDVILALDRNLIRTYVSPSSLETFGYAPEELVGHKTGTSAHPEDIRALRDRLQLLVDGQTEMLVAVNRRRHRDGRWIWIETCYRTVRDTVTGEIAGFVASARDVTARKVAEDQLAEANRRLQVLAGQDALTGLANRRTFDELLRTEFERAQREGSGLALIMFDVDRFKALNDAYGHQVGDDCLKAIAQTISNSLTHSNNVVARYGGEEFAVVLPAMDEAGAFAVAMRIRKSVLRLAFEHKACETGVVTVSSGVAALPPVLSADYPEALLRAADQALYQAKNRGRNTVVRASTLQPTNAARSTVAA